MISDAMKTKSPHMRGIRTSTFLASALGAFTLALATPTASAVVVAFQLVPTNDDGNPDISSEITMNVSDLGGGSVLFEIIRGSLNGSVASVYFDGDGLLSGMSFSSSDSSLGVDFGSDGSAQPPGVPFSFDIQYSFGAVPPPAQNGIDTGETGGFVGVLGGGNTFADIENSLFSGDFSVAMHVIKLGEDEEGSDFYISIPGDPAIPEPGLSLLGSLGAALLLLRRPQRNA